MAQLLLPPSKAWEHQERKDGETARPEGGQSERRLSFQNDMATELSSMIKIGPTQHSVTERVADHASL